MNINHMADYVLSYFLSFTFIYQNFFSGKFRIGSERILIDCRRFYKVIQAFINVRQEFDRGI